MTTLVLFALPGFFLVLALLAGRFPGERAIERARRAVRGRGPRRTTCTPIRPARRRPFAAVPRGGRLVGTRLARRPPPAACWAHHVNHFQGAPT